MLLPDEVGLPRQDPALWNASHFDPRVTRVAAIDPGFVWGLDDGDAAALVPDALLIGLGDSETQIMATDFTENGLPLWSPTRGSCGLLRRSTLRRPLRANWQGPRYWKRIKMTLSAPTRPARTVQRCVPRSSPRLPTHWACERTCRSPLVGERRLVRTGGRSEPECVAKSRNGGLGEAGYAARDGLERPAWAADARNKSRYPFVERRLALSLICVWPPAMACQSAVGAADMSRVMTGSTAPGRALPA
ncbi:hypothetical protein C7455_101951 [Roseicyclus mahoneyensis]|uniref:Uncharacterized protein n=1 Tax=Roseicyclus mahoneyensis TaxID=164332 RepID=A0A316GR82_9RHOB|nr:hypothetical protein C7455_101951 [Roseicyclus mahoneyensis]